MLKHLTLAAGLLAIMLSPARPQDDCSGPWLTATELMALSEEERSHKFRRYLDCASQSLSYAQRRMYGLSNIKIDEVVNDLAVERDRLNGLLETRTGALESAKAGMASLLTERDQLAGEVETLSAALEGMKERQAELRNERDELDEWADTLTELIDQAETDIAVLEVENTDLQAEVARLRGGLVAYRSQFFGRLRDILGARDDIRVVGDRFVFPTEVLFAPGSASLNAAGRGQIIAIADAVLELEYRIPASVNWVLQVNGHTDIRPVRRGGRFASNWELSTARALSVVKLLQAQGVSPHHLAAAGFGEYQPLDPRDTPEAFTRNRRIELKLTDDGPYDG